MNMENFKKTLWEYIQVILTSVIISFVVLYFMQISKVVGMSMQPTYHEGDIVLVDKVFYKQGEPERNDIVVIKYGDGQIIKRVIAIEGDKIEQIGSELYLNGELLEEDYINEEMYADDFSYVVPDGKIFVMGDNRNHSDDSRRIGYIDFDDSVVGRVFLKVF